MEKTRELRLAKAVGKAIASRRSKLRLTQEDVAERLGIGYEAVSRMERGLNIPTVTRLIELAEVLDCAVSELVTQSSDRALDQAKVIAQKIQRLSAKDRSATLQIMDILSDRLSSHRKAGDEF